MMWISLVMGIVAGVLIVWGLIEWRSERRLWRVDPLEDADRYPPRCEHADRQVKPSDRA